MAKSQINDRALVPLFHCLDRDGEPFDSSDFKRKRNLVIYFLTHPSLDVPRPENCVLQGADMLWPLGHPDFRAKGIPGFSPGWLHFLLSLEQAQRLMREQNAEVLVVTRRSVGEIQNLHSQHRLTYRILSDEHKDVFKKFIQVADQEEVAALFVTDKFGEVFFQYFAADVVDLPPFSDVVQSLAFIESQCPECGD
ncbi:MAG: redoxin domain-containing protein [Candidatus Omnitrophota bacterium]